MFFSRDFSGQFTKVNIHIHCDITYWLVYVLIDKIIGVSRTKTSSVLAASHSQYRTGEARQEEARAGEFSVYDWTAAAATTVSMRPKRAYKLMTLAGNLLLFVGGRLKRLENVLLCGFVGLVVSENISVKEE